MAEEPRSETDWRDIWAKGDLARFCFVSLGILLHATNETMLSTIMPAMVRDLAGIRLVGWSFAIYELGSIVAGAAAGRMISYISLRDNMAGAAAVYAVGALVCAMAPSMPWLLVGRLIEGAGGGALVSLAFVSVERLFPRAIWPQLFGIMSAVWGVAAFGGPLIGALVSENFGWRATFAVFAAGGAAMACISYIVLRTGSAAKVRDPGATPPFPFTTLAALCMAVLLIAMAGVDDRASVSAILLAVGLGGLSLFLKLDARRPASRLFPSKPFDWSGGVGVGLTMVATFSVATISFSIYGPLLLSSLHGIPPLTAGWIIASESISWSVLSILVATARPRHEAAIIVGGALMITTGILGFAWAIPAGNIGAILACALLQGGGFGIAWPFVTRMIVASAKSEESSIASSSVSAMQRIGYAVGAALAGIVANTSGFAHGFTAATAASVAPWLFLAFLPLALVGCAAATRLILMPQPD